jgi:hypothetical protein
MKYPPLPVLGNLIPREMQRDLYETLKEYAREAVELNSPPEMLKGSQDDASGD